MHPDVATGLGFMYVRNFWALFSVAFVGTLNPFAGNVSVFSPLERTAWAEKVVARDLTGILGFHNVARAFAEQWPLSQVSVR